ncbi:hypothetical protein AX16_003117 [Volvariella volvacea WC 439]|nr:hypothetical protein AX16_003117 [Volvariella volvacea WC 439]
MTSTPSTNEVEDAVPLQRPPSPPPYTTFAARGVHPPTFSAFKPRDFRLPSSQAMNHVAWNCDGKKLAAVGIDKNTRVWLPEKSMEPRAATMFSGGHSDDVDYVSWNPTHPDLFCTSSQRDRKLVFWDARQSRHVQQCPLKFSPVQTTYSPDGRWIACVSAGHQVHILSLGKETEDAPRETWKLTDKEPVMGSTAMFNHTGDGIILSHHQEHTLRVLDFPSLGTTRENNFAAHVGGCITIALDPRGRYLASGGYDSIVNLFELSDWICTRTITSCEYSINGLGFSFDGEYLAIASAGSYIDICATETGALLHRVPALSSSPTVSWHPSKYVFAYCGQLKSREGLPMAVALVSMFGLLE